MDQLSDILAAWKPGMSVSLHGVILDYMFKSGNTLRSIFELNSRIRQQVLLDSPSNEARDLVELSARCRGVSPNVELLDLMQMPPVGSDGPASIPADRVADITGVHLEPEGEAPGAVAVVDQNAIFDKDDTDTVFWQLSDIHFGRLDAWLQDPEELAAALLSCVAAVPDTRPDFVLVSGDLTSVADEAEMAAFVLFCKFLSRRLWGRVCPQRILVVPGNHDTVWQSDGTTDKLQRFRQKMGRAGCCITPFGTKQRKYTDPDVEVTRYELAGASEPPLALVRMSNGVEVLLLVSSYYSGDVDPRIRDLVLGLSASKGPGDDLLQLSRIDAGVTTHKYLELIRSSVGKTDAPRVALIHHNPVSYGRELSQNPLGIPLLIALNQTSVSVMLHGHAHLFEEEKDIGRRPDVSGLARSIPCSTLSSHAATGSHAGFMVHTIKNSGADRRLESWAWQSSIDDAFDADLLRRLYVTRL